MSYSQVSPGLSTRRGSVAIYLVLCVIAAEIHTGKAISSEGTGYGSEDSIQVECIDWLNETRWSHGPICKETGEPLSMIFGKDNFMYCGLEIPNETIKEEFVKLAKLTKTWQCRVAMSKARDFFVPFTIPVWGVVEEDHLHINNHMNFVFHVDPSEGKIVAAAAYPVRDRFQFAKVGSLISMHGPVRWFHRHTFESLSGANPRAPNVVDSGPNSGGSHVWAVAAGSVLSAMVTLLVAALLYKRKLKPRLIRRMKSHSG